MGGRKIEIIGECEKLWAFDKASESKGTVENQQAPSTGPQAAQHPKGEKASNWPQRDSCLGQDRIPRISRQSNVSHSHKTSRADFH